MQSRMQTKTLRAEAKNTLFLRQTQQKGGLWGLIDCAGVSYLSWIVTSLLEDGSRVQNSARLIAALPNVVRLPLMSLDVADWTFRTYSLGSILFDTL